MSSLLIIPTLFICGIIATIAAAFTTMALCSWRSSLTPMVLFPLSWLWWMVLLLCGAVQLLAP